MQEMRHSEKLAMQVQLMSPCLSAHDRENFKAAHAQEHKHYM